MAQAKNSITVKMTIEKETKGALRYAEERESDFEEAKIGTLYIRKSAFKEHGQVPKAIVVQVSF
jgi:hypothetical protein